MLHKILLQDVLAQTKADIEIFKRVIPFLHTYKSMCVAGGFLRKLLKNDCEVNDIDIFGTGELGCFKSHFGDYPSKTPNSWKWEYPKCPVSWNHDYMSKFNLNTMQELLNAFDMTICQLATDGHYLYYTTEAAEALHNGELKCTPACKIDPGHERIKKYIQYGYVIADPKLFNIYKNKIKAPKDSNNIDMQCLTMDNADFGEELKGLSAKGILKVENAPPPPTFTLPNTVNYKPLNWKPVVLPTYIAKDIC